MKSFPWAPVHFLHSKPDELAKNEKAKMMQIAKVEINLWIILEKTEVKGRLGVSSYR